MMLTFSRALIHEIPSQSLATDVPVSTVAKNLLDAIWDGAPVALISFNSCIPEGSPKIFRSAAGEVICIN
jgi:hypothetical protein